MKNKIAIYLLLAMIAVTAFAGISTRLISRMIRTDKKDESTLHVDPEPVKTVYLTNPNIETIPVIEDAAITEPETIPETVAQTETEPEPEPEPVIEWSPDPNDVVLIAKTIFGEANVCGTTERAAVAWTILNRVDSPEFPDNIRDVVTTPGQFAFSWDAPILPELYRLAEDVLYRHHAEHTGEGDVGRVLPAEYCYFWGDGKHNYFRTTNNELVYFDWTLPSPYGEE